MDNRKNRLSVRYLTVTAVMGAIGAVLMYLDIAVPLMPTFIKIDFSELPALIASFAMGPMSGVLVCVIKNLVHLTRTSTVGVGELSNLLLGILFVFPAGLWYQRHKNFKGALTASLLGAVSMALLGFFTNLWIIYPMFGLVMPLPAIVSAYGVINPNVTQLWQALLIFNVPFTLIKGLINCGLCFLIYKPISPLLKGRTR